ncbi:MAG: DUF2752 domain-containing protein [Ignavibacteria bacterium]|jgi:hypothetical protein
MTSIFGNIKKICAFINMEALMWVAVLVSVFFINPYGEQHFTLCPFHNLGIDFCPGCGIGRSISFLYHGDIVNSFNMHPLGFFAFFIILYRIIILQIKSIRNNKIKNEVTHGC